ncbi:MAG: glycosyltransferase [Verrucomicrobiae bacterium]|nr:glycosyltransferase [Verrucomicrobiae bacterium]
MTVSIVIPAFNEERLLPRTLAAVRDALPAFTDRGWNHEVVVCDNNSSDRTPDLARASGARVVFEPVNQIGRARNAGAAAACGDWLLFLDADSIPTRALFEDAANAIASGDVLFAGAVVRLDENLPPIESVLVGCWNLASRLFRWMAGSFILVEAAAFREVGGFHPDLYAAEELDLSRRLKALARRRRKRTIILTRHPLVSSARRLKLYPRRYLLRFFARGLLRPLSTPRDREACAMWYDGRR